MKLNLARKWRPKKLDDVIGQDLVISLIKNSLYRNLIFPVYLFSGPRGSGKTSTARLFASSLNCIELKDFIKSPKSVLLPCSQCISCNAMARLAHPDFIEIDAASNTGVENIRNIIEAASFSPTLSSKKIYLIDEAHMLSKSAFNAFLKILEEPPQNAIFMLATTEFSKIIATVRSRCFQLFFDPIKAKHIIDNLKFICDQENIKHDNEVLNLIASHADGSLRDALNILEKLRLSNIGINKDSAFQNLGIINPDKLVELLDTILDKNLNKLIDTINILDLKKYNALNIWKQFADLIYNIFLVKNNINVDIDLNIKSIENITHKISTEKLLNILDICSSYEFNITKSSMPYLNLELMFIKLIDKLNIKTNNNIIVNNNKINNSSPKAKTGTDDKVTQFVKNINELNDPLLSSIFNQSNIGLDNLNVNLEFSQDFIFFKDLLDDSKNTWLPIFKKIFGEEIKINFKFKENQIDKSPDNLDPNILSSGNLNCNKINKKKTILIKNSIINNRINIDVNDQEKWPRANQLLKIFPGKISLE